MFQFDKIHLKIQIRFGLKPWFSTLVTHDNNTATPTDKLIIAVLQGWPDFFSQGPKFDDSFLVRAS